MDSRIVASFARTGCSTSLQTSHEAGALRLRLPRGPRCVATLVNTGGGLVAGDRLHLTVSAQPGSDVTVTSVAAEKVYRAMGASTTRVTTRLQVADGASIAWLPQETILFDGARLDRGLTVELSGTAAFLGAETVIFGRLASGEPSVSGSLRDRWRVQRDGHLIFADETALEGAIGTLLDRPAVAGGARAVGLIVRVHADNGDRLDEFRARLGQWAGSVEAGVSQVGNVLVARLLAASPAQLRLAMIDALGRLDAVTTHRLWT